MDKIMAVTPSWVKLSQCVARLYAPSKPTFLDYPAANQWIQQYVSDLNYFVTNLGRNVVILNEPDIEFTQPPPAVDPRTLGLISQALRNAYWNGGNRLLYTLFPGPAARARLDPTGWNNFWNTYNMRSAGAPHTFDQWFGSVDPQLQGKYMLWHNGGGVFDRVALHCYADTPSEYASSVPANNTTLYQIQAMQQIDSSGWVYVTETSGADANGFDEPANGTALADFQSNVDAQFYPFVQAVHGYMLHISNADASSQFRHIIDCNTVEAYTAERLRLGFG